MKTNLLKTVLAGAALLVSSAVCAQIELAENVKNYFAVTGFNGNNEVTVSSTVFDGYSFEVQMPSTNNSVVKADKLRLDIAIQDVNSVGAKDQLRQESKEFETGAKSLTGDLQKLMANSYKFAGNQECVTVPVTVIDGARQKSFTYNISGSPIENKIIGVPETETDCRAAWAIITSNMKSFKKPLHDTYFGVRKGSYIELAGERMTFVNDKNLCEEPWTVDGVKRETLDNYEITATDVTTDADTYIAKIYLPAGSALAVGFSESILQKDALITFDLSALYETYGTALPKQISPLMDGMKTPETAVFSFIQAFDGLVGLICDAKEVPTTVEFTPAAAGFTVYPGSAEALNNQTAEQFIACQELFPNAMAVQKYGEGTLLNNVIELTNGEYVCKSFVLTDLSENPTPEFATSTAWYSPVDFTAIAGLYTRKNLTAGYASVCLPFAISTEMEGVADILTYDSYDGDVWAYFVSGEENEAGVPCNIIGTGDDIAVEFDNTPIVAEIANGNSTYGTYTATDEYATYYYGVNTTINKFCPLAGNLYPFRACLDLQAGGKDVAAKIISTPTAIKNVESTNANTIYNVSGAKVSKIAQPGLYIVNGKKMFVK